MLDLLDWRQQITDLYRDIRERDASQSTWQHFCDVRDKLFGEHSQSALDAQQKAKFTGLDYFAYNPEFRVSATVDYNVEPKQYEVEIGDDGLIKYRLFAQVQFDLPTGSGELSLFWIEGYGGGLFVPFGDTTNRETTYGAGRYLYDTIKGADLGAQANHIILDFNYAYNPSCSYNPRWVCPLAPLENRLSFQIPAGEKHIERY